MDALASSWEAEASASIPDTAYTTIVINGFRSAPPRLGNPFRPI
jgi:hypothetical protein